MQAQMLQTMHQTMVNMQIAQPQAPPPPPRVGLEIFRACLFELQLFKKLLHAFATGKLAF
jgi:hypothetical protein